MVRCSVVNCRSDSERKIPGLTFHAYPNNPELLKKWIAATGRAGWVPKKFSKICCCHFDVRNIIKKDKNTFIRRGAVPVLMPRAKLRIQNNKSNQTFQTHSDNIKIVLVQNTQDVDMKGKFDNQLLQNTQDTDIEDNKDNIQLLHDIEDIKPGNKDKISFVSVQDKNLSQDVDEDVKDYASFTVIGTHTAVHKRPFDGCDNRSDTVSAKSEDEKSNRRFTSVSANSEKRPSPETFRLQRKLQIKNEIHKRQRRRIKALQERVSRLQKKNLMFSQTIRELQKVPEIRTGAAQDREMNVLKTRNLQLQEKNISLVEIINKLKTQSAADAARASTSSKCKTCGT